VPAAEPPGEPVSRRKLLGAAGGLAVTLAGCGSSVSRAPTNPEFRAADADVLDELLGVANRAVAAYGRVAGLVTGARLSLVRRIGVQEAAHVYALTGATYRLGGEPTPAAASYGFPGAVDGPSALALAAQVEDASIAALIDALPKLADIEARGLVASVLADDAQHAALVAQARGLPPLSGAIVRGRS
jgi:hypothetical protein